MSLDKYFHKAPTGRLVHVLILHDDDHPAPWLEDGRGVVTGSERKTKRPGWRVLDRDRRGAYRYYDVQASMKRALEDGWGVSEATTEKLRKSFGRKPTRRMIAAAAVEHDFQRMRGWCKDDWSYVGVLVKDVETSVEESFWGIESYDYDYIQEVIDQLSESIYTASIAALISGGEVRGTDEH